MKKYIVLFAVGFFVLLAISGLLLAETLPEFDGGYLKTTDGRYGEIRATKAFRTAVAYKGQNLMDVLSLQTKPYIVDKSSLPAFAASIFKGFFLKGSYKFEAFSLHPLRERTLKDNEVFYENRGPAKRDQPFYVPGDKIEFRQKAVGQNAYYFEPRDRLAKGEYIGWLGDDIWLFRLE
ncbi:MAG: hypothetical protein NT022_11275 [Deltaproteobacteria bacterium]|nr:hypothetical protein [Deltaproteobacteria bacterium]